MPPLLVEIAVERKSSTDVEWLSRALFKLAEGAGISAAMGRETGQTVISGLSEQHLEDTRARIASELVDRVQRKVPTRWATTRAGNGEPR